MAEVEEVEAVEEVDMLEVEVLLAGARAKLAVV